MIFPINSNSSYMTCIAIFNKFDREDAISKKSLLLEKIGIVDTKSIDVALSALEHGFAISCIEEEALESYPEILALSLPEYSNKSIMDFCRKRHIIVL